MLLLSETTGVLLPSGSVYPSYLTGFADTLRAIEKCSRIPYKTLSLPHTGIIRQGQAEGFFDRAAAAMTACHHFIVQIHDDGLAPEDMIVPLFHKYSDVVKFGLQPKEAFDINAHATIACTLRECGKQ